jgi:hypothetical protein
MIPSSAARSVRGRLCAGALCAGVLLLASAADAQQPLQITPTPSPAATAASATAVAPEAQKGARQEELEKIQAEQKRAADLAAKLKAELDAIGEDRRKLNALLIGSAPVFATPKSASRRPKAGSTPLDATRIPSAARLQAAARSSPRCWPPAASGPQAAAGPPGQPRGCAAVGAHRDPARRRTARHESRGRHADRRSCRTVKVRSEIAAERDGLGRDLGKRHFHWRPGPAPRSQPRVTAGLFTPDRSQLRTTLDPQCRRRVSCPARRDGAHFGKHRPVCTDGEPVATMGAGPRSAAAFCATGEPAGALCRVP